MAELIDIANDGGRIEREDAELLIQRICEERTLCSPDKALRAKT